MKVVNEAVRVLGVNFKKDETFNIRLDKTNSYLTTSSPPTTISALFLVFRMVGLETIKIRSLQVKGT